MSERLVDPETGCAYDPVFVARIQQDLDALLRDAARCPSEGLDAAPSETP